MPITEKEALDVLGYDATTFENVEAFRTQVESEWIKRDVAPTDKEIHGKVLGKMNGAIQSQLKGISKEFGIDGIEFDKMRTEEAIQAVVTKMGKTISELREAKADGSTPKEIAELQKKVDDLTKAKADLEKLNGETAKKYTELETSVNNEKSAAKRQAVYDRAYGKVPFRKDMSTHERRGFDAHIRENYVVGFDDDGKEVLTDKDGHQIPGKKAGSFLTVDEAVLDAAETEKLTEAKGATAPARTTRQIGTSTADDEQNDGANKRPAVKGRRLAY
jgi:hypothetical protein